MRRRFIVSTTAGLAIFLGSFVAAPSVASNTADCRTHGSGGSGQVGIGRTCFGRVTPKPPPSGITPPSPPRRTILCARPAGSGGPPVSLCIAPRNCPDGVAWEWEELRDSHWVVIYGPYCHGNANPGPPDPPTPPPPSPRQIRDRAIRLLPTIAIGTAPDGAGLTNAETILWAATAVDRRLPDLTLLGQTVHLRIHLTTTHWTYGDGTTATLDHPGTPYPKAGTCETAQCPGYDGHTYHQPGPVTITLTTTWHADYQLTDGPWQPITEPVTAPASRQTLTIREARSVIVH